MRADIVKVVYQQLSSKRLLSVGDIVYGDFACFSTYLGKRSDILKDIAEFYSGISRERLEKEAKNRLTVYPFLSDGLNINTEIYSGLVYVCEGVRHLVSPTGLVFYYHSYSTGELIPTAILGYKNNEPVLYSIENLKNSAYKVRCPSTWIKNKIIQVEETDDGYMITIPENFEYGNIKLEERNLFHYFLILQYEHYKRNIVKPLELLSLFTEILKKKYQVARRGMIPAKKKENILSEAEIIYYLGNIINAL